jgi:hypothetical protein
MSCVQVKPQATHTPHPTQFMTRDAPAPVDDRGSGSTIDGGGDWNDRGDLVQTAHWKPGNTSSKRFLKSLEPVVHPKRRAVASVSHAPQSDAQAPVVLRPLDGGPDSKSSAAALQHDSDHVAGTAGGGVRNEAQGASMQLRTSGMATTAHRAVLHAYARADAIDVDEQLRQQSVQQTVTELIQELSKQPDHATKSKGGGSSVPAAQAGTAQNTPSAHGGQVLQLP